MIKLKLAYKFLFPKGKGKTFYSLSKFFTIGSIAIASAAFLIVLSVFRGYIDTISHRYKDVYSDLIITNTVPEQDDIKKTIETKYSNEIEQIGYTGYMELLLSKKGRIHGVAVEFIENPYFLNKIKKYKVSGDLYCVLKEKGIVLTKTVAESLNLKINDLVNLIFVGKNTKSHSSYFKLCATVDYGIHNLDNRFAYLSKKSVEFDFPSGIYDASVKIKLKDSVDGDKLVQNIRKEFSPMYIAKTWKDINYGTIESAKFDKLIISIILAILIAIAAFNVAVTLVLSMRYSKEDLAILWILGFKSKNIRQIFLIEGFIISIIAIFFSVILWLSFYFGLKYFISFTLPYGIYLMREIPIYISFKDFLLSVFTVLIFVFTVSYIVSFLWKKRGVLKAFK